MTLVPGGRLDTTLLPEDQQFVSWSSHSRHSRMAPLTEAGFSAQSSFWDLGLVTVTDNLLDPFTVERDDALIRATGADHALLVLLFAGTTRFEADGRDDLCEAGDLFVSDFRFASRHTSSRLRCATVTFGRAFLEEAIGARIVHGRLPRSPETAMLGSFLAKLVAVLPQLPQSAARSYARMLRDLLATAVADVPQPHRPAGRGRRSRALAYMAAQPPGSLSISAMADALGLTRSTLYRMFEQDGGVLAHDRLRRLRALHRALADPLEQRGIGVLGMQQGFVDKAQLARAFRRTFGYSMSSLRERALLGPATPAADEAGRFRTVVDRLNRDGR